MDYKKYAYLDNVSTFQFESYLGKLKSMSTKVKREKEITIKKGDIYLINNCKNCFIILIINSNNINLNYI